MAMIFSEHNSTTYMSEPSSSLASQLQHAAQAGLQSVQQSFDAYQSAHFPKRTPEFFCLELCGEAGELANLEKKRWKGKAIDDAHIADEAADVCISLMNYANARGIDLGNAVRMKLERIERKRAECERNGEIY
jgi:NTP pyrophosphatase (non-canonical NTP hydrolase)